MQNSKFLIASIACGIVLGTAVPACVLGSAGTKASPEGADVGEGGGGGDVGGGGEGGDGEAGAGGGGHSGEGGGVSACTPGRTALDRPDDDAGYQVRVNYVLPSDGVDERLDTDGRIARSVAALTRWFTAQSRGRSLRLDTCDGALDVRFVVLPDSDAALAEEGVFIRDAIERAMGEAGLLHPQKIEAVYYGGAAREVCGNGPLPPGLVGHVAAVYLKGTFANAAVPPCASNPVGASETEPGYFEFVMLHELAHALGAVPSCAPHETENGHTSDGPTDLMYAGPEPWRPSQLDVGRDDYFDHGNAGCIDLAKSTFIAPLPADAVIPPGW